MVNKRIVLIIADTPEDRATWQRFLTEDSAWHYTFLEAGYGTEGLRLTQAVRPDCILLAHPLPDGDGWGVLETLDNDARLPACPVIMLAEAGDVATVVRAMQLGAQDYLLKEHLTPTELQRAVSHAIEKAQLVQAHRQAEEALRQNEERFRVALQHSHVVVFNQDADLRYTWIHNPRHSFKADEVLGKTDADLLPPEEAARLMELKRRVLESGVGTRTEILLTPYGQLAWYDLTVEPLRKASGQVVGITGAAIDITNRRLIEEKFQQRSRLIELSYDPIFVWDLDGGIVEWNHGSEQLYGYSRAEALGQISHQLLKTIHPLPLVDLRQQLLQEGGWTGELHQTTKDGREVLVESRHQLTELNGRWLVLETNRDITARKQAEEALRESEARLRAITEVLPLAVWECDAEGRLLSMTGSLLSNTGRTSAEFENTGWREALYPEDRAGYAQAWQACVATGSDWDQETRYITGDGAIIVIHSRGRPVYDAAGKIERWVGMSIDITERKQAEESLRQNEQRLRTLLELLPVGAWLTDVQGSIVLDNPASQRIWGVRHARQEHYGQYKGWWANSGEPLKSEDWSLSRALTSGESFLNELIDIETFDGERKTILTSVVPIKTAGEQVVGAVVVNEDVTHLRQIEQALRQSEERYRLAAEAERAARLEAEAAQQSLAFLAEIRERNRLAQELHDNVAQALGYLNLKMTVVRDLLANNKLDEVETNLRELKQIVNETYADIRGEIFNLRTDPVSTVNFLDTLRQYLDKYRRFYQLEVELVFEADESHFDFPSEISIAFIRVIQEALMNVRKHAQINQAIIRLGQAGKVLYISVEDQGRGFEAGAISRQSTSYGVNIMRERIEGVGGTLQIESVPGQGTRVTLLYPRR